MMAVIKVAGIFTVNPFIQAMDRHRYGIGNIDLYKRPIIRKNSLGQPLPSDEYSTIYSMTFAPEETGEKKYVLVPGVRHGLDRQMTSDEALKWYKQSGEYLGKFNSIESADKYAMSLHKKQAQLYKKKKVANE